MRKRERVWRRGRGRESKKKGTRSRLKTECEITDIVMERLKKIKGGRNL